MKKWVQRAAYVSAVHTKKAPNQRYTHTTRTAKSQQLVFSYICKHVLEKKKVLIWMKPGFHTHAHELGLKDFENALNVESK